MIPTQIFPPNKILILDGAMGTQIQLAQITPDDLTCNGVPYPGDNDLLNLTRPDLIFNIHKAYLDAGADMITTNTFNSNAISQSDYNFPDVYALNYQGAKIARRAADSYPNRLVAGSIGPTNKSLSMPSDLSRPDYRALSFDDFKASCKTQIRGLIDGGADLLLFETIFDPLVTKAGLAAADEVFREKKALPIMISATIGENGRLLTSQTLEAFYFSTKNDNVISFGLNCSFGPKAMLPFINEINNFSALPVTMHANAGLPDQNGRYTLSPTEMFDSLRPLLEKNLLNLVGGCCGTTPAHIAYIKSQIDKFEPKRDFAPPKKLMFAGLEAKSLDEITQLAITQTPDFQAAINADDYLTALELCADQSENGCTALKINFDNTPNAPAKLISFLRYMYFSYPVSKLPLIIESADFSLIFSALKNIQGRHLASLSLSAIDDDFPSKVQALKSLNAGLILTPTKDSSQTLRLLKTAQTLCDQAACDELIFAPAPNTSQEILTQITQTLPQIKILPPTSPQA